MTDKIAEALAKLPRDSKGQGILDRRSDHYLDALMSIAEALNWEDWSKVNLAHGLVSPKMSVGYNFFRWRNDTDLEALMFIKAQPQIGKGAPPKWTLAGGGFINSALFETPEACTKRNGHTLFGIDLVLPKRPMWVMLTKAPYDVTNETQVHGIVCKLPVLVNADESEFLLERLSGKGSQGRWCDRAAISGLLQEGRHSLDDREIEFIDDCMQEAYPFARVVW